MDSWLIPLLQKRSLDGMRILCDLLEAGILKGECSANDIREISLSQPNIIGGVFKILKKFGFKHTERRIKTIAARKHSRRVDVWELENHMLAMKASGEIKKILLDAAFKTAEQKELF